MQFFSRKLASKGSPLQGTLGSGPLHFFHALHLGLSLGNPFEPQVCHCPRNPQFLPLQMPNSDFW